MVNIHPHKDVEKMVAYHRDHLAADTAAARYYSQGGQSVGQWYGKAAAMLGLSGVVDAADFERVSSNLHPVTGQQLTPRKRKDAVAAYDFCVSVFKSGSVVGLGMDDKRVVDILRAAAVETLKEAEALASVRLRKGSNKRDESRLTGNLAAAVFEHFSSRLNDPQWHVHCIIPNITWDAEEGRFKALQAGGLYRGSGMLTEVFRTTVQRKLREIGYETVRSKKGVEIVGVAPDVIKTFSKRHTQIESTAAALGGVNNSKLRATIAHKNRAHKDTSKTLEGLRADWLDQLTPTQVAKLETLKASAVGPLPVNSTVTADEALEWSARHHLERLSVVPVCKLFREALAFGNGFLTLDDLRAALAKNATGQFLVDGDAVTTLAMLADEQKMVGFVNGGKGVCQSLNPGVLYTGEQVSEEQSAAVSLLLDSPDRVTALHGPAGAGKTTTLKGLRLGLDAANRKVVFCAPTAAAVDKLRADFPDAVTLQWLLTDKEMKAKLANSVVVLDEAGFASVEQMNDLFDLTQQAPGLRFVLAGDVRQHKGIQAGDGLRILESESKLTRAELTTIYRQKDAAYRSAVELLKDGKSEDGFRALDALGWVKEFGIDERYERLAGEFLEARTAGKTCLTVCATWREAALATDSIRETLKAAGRLSLKDHSLTALAPCNLTGAERRHARCYEPGSIILFRRKTDLFARNERLTVLGSQDGYLRVEKADGSVLLFDPAKDADLFAVFEPRPIAVAAGEELLLRANGRAAGGEKLTNGELVTVSKVFQSGSIVLADGRIIPANYGQFAHGYAVTTQSSQSKDVDVVLMAIDAQSAHGGTSQETLYVGASRGKERCSIYTDDRDELATAFQRSGERMSALEFVQQQQARQQAQVNNTPQTHEKTNTPSGLGAGNYQPFQSLPGTRLAPHIAGLNPALLCQTPGGRGVASFWPEPHGYGRGNPSAGLQVEPPFCGLPSPGCGLPDAPLYPYGDEDFQACLGR